MNLNRREFLRNSAAAGAGLLCARAGTEEAQRPPNLLVIFCDDLCFRGVGFNNPAVKTPHLDQLAHEGLILDTACIASPICVASRASILTSLFPQQHGSVGLDATGFQHCVVESGTVKTLAHHLTDHGYATAFCGKSHLGDPRTYGFHAGQEHPGRDDNDAFSFASTFLRERTPEEAPFLLWVSPHQPHIPLVPPQQYLDLYRETDMPLDPNWREAPLQASINNQGLPGEHYYRDAVEQRQGEPILCGPPRTREEMQRFIRAYYAVMSHLDDQVGRLVETLKESGHYDDTVLFFLSDNGYHLGNHGLGNKITMHEESVRIPMFLHGRRLPMTGVRSGALVSSLDVFPTCLALAGAPLPYGIMGRSLLPILNRPVNLLRAYVASECVGVGGEPGMGHRMVRSEHWKYVLTDTSEEALFDLRRDPYELENVAAEASHGEVLALHRNFMREWMGQVGDTHLPPPA